MTRARELAANDRIRRIKNFGSLTARELEAACRKRGILQNGKKKDLVKRLLGYQDAQAAAELVAMMKSFTDDDQTPRAAAPNGHLGKRFGHLESTPVLMRYPLLNCITQGMIGSHFNARQLYACGRALRGRRQPLFNVGTLERHAAKGLSMSDGEWK